MLAGFEGVVEQRIREARERGDLDELPGNGRPLVLDDDSLVPPELRLAYRILRNAGYVPEEVRLRGEIADLAALLGTLETGEARLRAVKRLDLLRARLAARGGREPAAVLDEGYREAVLERLSRTR